MDRATINHIFLPVLNITRPNPVDHGYGSRYYWGMVETGPFFLGDVQLIQLTPKINIKDWVPRKINK